MTEKELREQRAKLIHEARQILEKAEADKRILTAEERERWDKLDNEAEAIKQHIERLERQAREEQTLTEPTGRRTQPAAPGHQPPGSPLDRRIMLEVGNAERRQAFRTWLLAGSDRELSSDQIEMAKRNGVDVRNRQLHVSFPRVAPHTLAEARSLEIEQRAGGVGTGSAGGFTVAQGFWRSLEAALLAFGGMREVSTVIRTEGFGDLPIPTANDTTQTGVILAENTAAAEQDITYGQVVLQSFKYSSKMTRLSVELLEDTAIDVEGFTGQALGERIGRITNSHFTTGTGTGQPRGAVTASTLGFTGAVSHSGSPRYNELVELQHSVDPAYRNGGRWMFHDATLKRIKLLVDTQGRPLWLAGMNAGEPDTILGDPYTINQDMPQPGPSAKIVLYGNFMKYWIRDVVGFTLLRLDERFAEFHQVAFLAFSRHDGDLLDAGVTPIKHLLTAAT